MTLEIKSMERAGWKVVSASSVPHLELKGHEIICFARETNPNAFVDFEAVKRAIDAVNRLNENGPMCRSCRAAVEEISAAIRKL